MNNDPKPVANNGPASMYTKGEPVLSPDNLVIGVTYYVVFKGQRDPDSGYIGKYIRSSAANGTTGPMYFFKNVFKPDGKHSPPEAGREWKKMKVWKAIATYIRYGGSKSHRKTRRSKRSNKKTRKHK
jgi:hypothetical protein